jgi:hypothetical protein
VIPKLYKPHNAYYAGKSIDAISRPSAWLGKASSSSCEGHETFVADNPRAPTMRKVPTPLELMTELLTFLGASGAQI